MFCVSNSPVIDMCSLGVVIRCVCSVYTYGSITPLGVLVYTGRVTDRVTGNDAVAVVM